jgi:hypothetical protein
LYTLSLPWASQCLLFTCVYLPGELLFTIYLCVPSRRIIVYYLLVCTYPENYCLLFTCVYLVGELLFTIYLCVPSRRIIVYYLLVCTYPENYCLLFICVYLPEELANTNLITGVWWKQETDGHLPTRTRGCCLCLNIYRHKVGAFFRKTRLRPILRVNCRFDLSLTNSRRLFLGFILCSEETMFPQGPTHSICP